ASGLKATRRKAGQLVARGDLELLEHLAQVVLHRSRADEELRADVGVGETIPGELGDLRLLGREHATRLVGTGPGSLPRCLELPPGALGERLGPGMAEHLVCGSKFVAGVDAPVLAAQPLAVDQVCAREMDGDPRAPESFYCLAVQELGSLAVAQQRP